MADFKLFLPVFFLLSLSFLSVYGDTGSLTVVAGKSYKIDYDAKYVQVLGVQPNKVDQGLIFSIQATSPAATLELTLPRELIDATKKDGSNDSFIVLVDGTFTSYVEKNSIQTSRTVLIQVALENKELEIIGTHLAGSENSTSSTSQIPSQPSQTQFSTNQTLQQTNQTLQQQTQQNPTSAVAQNPTMNTSSQNLHFGITGKQIIEYSVIASAILVLIIVLASSKKSKTRKHIGK